MLGRTDIRDIYNHYGISQEQIINSNIIQNMINERAHLVSMVQFEVQNLPRAQD
jgi:hypothetical protein